MEPLGARDAHKLPRITGSNPGSKKVSEGPNRDVGIATVGQSDSCSIYQQHGEATIKDYPREVTIKVAASNQLNMVYQV